MAGRSCFTAMPAYLQEIPQAPRVGPQSRAGYEADGMAARLAIVGEPAIVIDWMSAGGKRKCAAPSSKMRFRSPQPEPRAITIDCHENRRAASEPPVAQATRTAQTLGMQCFGVLPDIDEALYGRRHCASPKQATETRTENGRRALKFGDIEGVPTKKKFVGALSPRRSPSPEGIAFMKTIDVDAPTGKRQTPAKTPSRGILPMDSPSYSLTCPANLMASPRTSPRARSYDYFEQVLSADRYANLIGRPTTRNDKGLRRMNLALELERHEKFNPALIYEMASGKDNCNSVGTAISTTASGVSTPFQQLSVGTPSVSKVRGPISSLASRLKDLEMVQSKGGPGENLADLRLELEEQKLSSLHKRALAEDANEDELADVIDSDSQKEAYIQLILEKVEDKMRNQPAPMPLGLRRVVASLLPKNENISDNMAQDLRIAVRASAQTISDYQGMRSSRKPSCLSPRRHPGGWAN